MSKKLLSEDTIINTTVGDSNNIPIGEYRNFLCQAIGKEFIDSMDYSGFSKWLFSNCGKTLKETVEEHNNNYKAKNMDDLMSEKRFMIVSKPDKAFISAFDKELNERGYDCENIITSGLTWGKFMIVYGKTGTKSRPCAVRIYIKDDGEIQLRFFLNKVDKHREYIEKAPVHIKNAFIFDGGDCKSCNTMCAPGKTYTIDGQLIQKCNHSTFYFNLPTVEKLPDYMELFSKFYPKKKAK